MKKFLTVLLSFQLILFSSTLSWAADGAEGETTPQDTTLSASDAKKILTKEDTTNWTHWVKQLLVLATSCAGTTMLISCPLAWKLPSVYLFVAGAISHVVAENNGAQEYSKQMEKSADSLRFTDDRIEQLKKSGNLQLATVQAMITDQENLKKYADNKLIAMGFMTGLYWGSVVAALIEGAAIVTGYDVAGCTGVDPGSAGVATVLISLFAPAAFGLSTSKDGWDNMISGILAPFVTLVVSLKVAEAGYYQFGWTRAVTFGALAIVSTILTAELGGRISIIAENITKLRALETSLKETQTEDEGYGFDPDGESSGGSGGAGSGSAYTASGSIGSQTFKTCATSTSSGLSVGTNCSNPARFTPPKLEGDFNLPPLTQMTQDATNMANAAARGDVAAARASGAGIASNAGRMRDLAKKVMKRFNEIQKKNGKPEIDFEKQMNQRANEMLANVGKAMGPSLGPLASANPNAGLLSPETKEAKDKVAAVVSTSPSGATTEIPKNLFSGLGNEPAVTNPTNQPTLEDSLGKFESSVSDINNNKSASIFDILSNRYVLNYEKVMTKKTVSPPLNQPDQELKNSQIKK